MKHLQSRVYKIYALTDPDTSLIRYIGKTSQALHNRLAEHMSHIRRNSYKENWIKKLKRESKRPGIILLADFDSVEICNQQEVAYINYYRIIGCPLVNLLSGGDGGSLHSQETIEKIRLARSKQVLSEKHLKAFLTNRIGTHHSDETKERIRQGNLGKKMSQDTKNLISKANTKPFVDQNGVVYYGIRNAAKTLQLSTKSICNVLTGKKKQVKGYTFNYINP